MLAEARKGAPILRTIPSDHGPPDGHVAFPLSPRPALPYSAATISPSGEPQMTQRLALTLTALLLSAGHAHAGEVADIAAGVEMRMANGDYAAAVTEAREVLSAVWENSPSIGFTDMLLLVEPASGFGIYNPRADNIYKQTEPIVIYAEPFGYGFGSPGEGLYSIGFYVDLQVQSAEGEVLADVPNVTELDMSSRFPNKEFQANLTYNLDGIVPGKYRLITTLRDKNSAKFGTFETEIEIAP